MIFTLLVVGFILLSTIFQMILSIRNYQHRNASIPENVRDVYDQEKYQKWLQYFMESSKLDMIEQVTSTVLMIGLLLLGGFSWMYHLATTLSTSMPIQTLIFMGIYFVVSFVISLVFSYLSTFKIEQKYGFNKTTMKTFVLDKIKSILLTIVLGGGLLYLVSIIFENTGPMFYLWTYLVLIVIILLTNLLYVKVFVPLFNKLTPLEDGLLKTMIEEYANQVGYQISKISVMNASLRSTKLNAYFSGFGKMKHIVLYDTLLEAMSNEEIVAVLAHEIGHAKHKHVLTGTLQSLIVIGLYMGMLFIVLQYPGFYTAFGIDEVFLGFGIILFMLLFSPLNFILGYITSSISRKHEYQADHFSASTYQKSALISALKVLSRSNFSNLTPDPLYVKLTYSHPPISSRIAEIEKI